MALHVAATVEEKGLLKIEKQKKKPNEEGQLGCPVESKVWTIVETKTGEQRKELEALLDQHQHLVLRESIVGEDAELGELKKIDEQRTELEALLDQHQSLVFKVSIDQQTEQRERPKEKMVKNGKQLRMRPGETELLMRK